MSNRRAVFAGQFYPAEPAEIHMTVASAFRHCDRVQVAAALQPRPGSPTPNTGIRYPRPRREDEPNPWSFRRPLLTMLPHAGYIYCGHVLAATLKGADLPRRLIILGPKHTQPGQALAVWAKGAWDIPTGRIPVDGELAQELLREEGGYVADTVAHQQEHDIEVLLPFLQATRPDIKILPIVTNRTHNLDIAARALATVVERHQHEGDDAVAIIISSDMNHYQNVKETRRKDAMAIDALYRLDEYSLLNVVQQNDISMCGVLPALIGIMACRHLRASQSWLMGYDTSGSAFGDTDRVVGYAGLRIW